MNNIQKNFKMKSRLRGLADGGVLGSGAAGRAEKALAGRAAQLAAMEAEAMGQAPTPPPPPPPPPAPKETKGLADGGPNMLQRGVNAVGDYVGRIGPAWSESNAQFEATNPSFGQRMDRALMPHTGFGSARWCT